MDRQRYPCEGKIYMSGYAGIIQNRRICELPDDVIHVSAKFMIPDMPVLSGTAEFMRAWTSFVHFWNFLLKQLKASFQTASIRNAFSKIRLNLPSGTQIFLRFRTRAACVGITGTGPGCLEFLLLDSSRTNNYTVAHRNSGSG